MIKDIRRVLRSGAWNNYTADLFRSHFRNWFNPDRRNYIPGFRCVYPVNTDASNIIRTYGGGTCLDNVSYHFQAHRHFPNYLGDDHSYQGLRCIYPTMEK